MRITLLWLSALFALPLAAQTINPNQIRPSTTTGQVLTTNAGVSTWLTPNTTINGVPCPLGGNCTVSGGGGSINPGLQYTLPVYTVGGTNVQSSNATVDSTLDNFTFPGVVNAYTSTAKYSTFKGPRVDVTFASFGVGCGNPADPTGAADSTCAIVQANAYVESLDNDSTGSTPILYFPAGLYKISSAIQLRCDTVVVGDEMGATTIEQTNGSANLFTVIAANEENFGDSCSGGLYSLTLMGTGHLGTGTLVEEDSTPGYTTRNLRLYNGGGRGLNLEGSSERTKNYNLHIDSVRWPIQLTHNANENHWWGLNIANPGTDASGYCWGAMCVNGSYPSVPPSTPAIVSVSKTDSTHVTVTMTGTIPAGLEVGHYGALSGVTEDSTYNQNPALITALTQISGTQYTVTMQQTVSTAGPYTDGTWSIVWRPDIHQAVWVEAVNNWFHGGSVKSLQFIGGMGFHASENDGEDGIYFEGYPYDGEPRLNAAVVANGAMPLTSTTATITTSSTTVPVASTMWFPDYVNDPADITEGLVACVGGPYYLMPADALAGSTATSTAFPSVTRGTREAVSGCFSGDGAFHFAGRGSTAYAWPAGSIIERGVYNDYGDGALIAHNHINSIESPTVAGFTTDCLDQSWNGTTRSTSDYPVGFTTCADLLVGLAPDGYIGNPNGASAGALLGGTLASVDDNSVYTGGTEAVGEGYIKAFDDAAVLSHTPVNNAPFLTQAQITAGSLPTSVVGDSPYQNILYGSATGLGGLTTPVYSFTQNDTEAGSNDFFGVGGSTGIGNNPGMNFSISGKSFTTSYCLSDRGSTSGTQALTRLCAEGSPYFSGQTGGFSIQYWNGSSWVEEDRIGNSATTFSVPTTVNSTLTVTGSASANSLTATTSVSAADAFIGLSGGFNALNVTPSGVAATQPVAVEAGPSATSSANVNSPFFDLQANYWNGSGSPGDLWSFVNSLGTGTNPTSTLLITHSGSPGTATVSLPSATITNLASGSGNCVQAGSGGLLTTTSSPCGSASAATVVTDVLFSAPTWATSFPNLQNASGNPGTWTTCSGLPNVCGGGGAGSSTYALATSSPSLSGASIAVTASNATYTTWSSTAPYSAGAPVTYSGVNYYALLPNTNEEPDTNPTYWHTSAGYNALTYRHLGCSTLPGGVCTAVTKFTYDVWFYVPSTDSGIQALEFDPDVYVGNYEYFLSMQCDPGVGWRFWNMAGGDWTQQTSTGGNLPIYPCQAVSETNTWHHLQLQGTISTANHTYAYQNFAIDGVPYFSSLNNSYSALSYTATDGLNVQMQVDLQASASSPVTVYYDLANLSVN